MFRKEFMKPDPQKIKKVQEMAAPENKKALHSFLRPTNCMKRFIHNHSTQTYHLRELP